MSNGESSEPIVLRLQNNGIEDTKADIDVWEEHFKPSSEEVRRVRALLAKAGDVGLNDSESRKLQKIRDLATEPRSYGVQMNMRLEPPARKGWWRGESGKKWPPEDPQPRDIEKVREQSEPRYAYDKKARFPEPQTTPPSETTPVAGRRENPLRKGALEAITKEAGKGGDDRLSEARGKRIKVMRSPYDRIVEKRLKKWDGKDTLTSQEAMDDLSERVRRINILLRAGVYDQKTLRTLPDVVQVEMTRARESDDRTKRVEKYTIDVKKSDLEDWLFDERGKDGLKPHERQRLYVLGRKKIDFKFNEKTFLEDYFKRNPKHRINEGDSVEEKEAKQKIIDAAVKHEKVFQKEQKELADALEVVALPMIRTIFRNRGHNVDVYLTSANDDIAGGLDVAIEFRERNGKRMIFHDGKPMRMVIDMTYARMWNKAEKDLERGRISQEAYDILKGNDENVPDALGNARAMKLFRTVVETLGDDMSTQTFGKNGPLSEPQAHIPRLIGGLDWDSAFTEISNWVALGNKFNEQFKDSELAANLEKSIVTQLTNLHRLASEDSNNPKNHNTPYLADLLKAMRLKAGKPGRKAAKDRSLANINRLLDAEAETSHEPGLAKEYQQRFYEAAMMQVKINAERGGHVRGDTVGIQRRAEPVTLGAEGRLESKREPLSATPLRSEPNKEVSTSDEIQKHLEEVLKIEELAKIRELERLLDEQEKR